MRVTASPPARRRPSGRTLWMIALCLAATASPRPAAAQLPPGFTPIFNGRDLSGWHPSRTTHQGSTPDARVEDGAIVLRQSPYGQGGLLLTDRKYRNFELYLETKVPWGINSGIFFRSTESGSAYQIEINGGGAANTGSLISEMMPISRPAPTTEPAKTWKETDWNSFRLRVEGDVPHMTLWVNGVQVWDVQQERNDKVAGETDGFIGIQTHWTNTYTELPGGSCCKTSWKPGAALLVRNVGIKELP